MVVKQNLKKKKLNRLLFCSCVLAYTRRLESQGCGGGPSCSLRADTDQGTRMWAEAGREEQVKKKEKKGGGGGVLHN